MRKNLRRCWIWAVAALLVLSTLTPAIGRTLAFAQGHLAPWSVLCASPVSPALQDGTQPGDMGGMGDHCPWCMHRADGAAPPPPALAANLDLLHLSFAVPRLFLQAPRPLFAWSAAQPRAPPQQG
jgi:hypothetical protein